jgi:hypothetical protein
MVMYQRPNKSIVITAVGLVLYLSNLHSWLARIGAIVFVLSFTLWGWQEIIDGASWFRKLLGYIGLGAVVIFLFVQLRA